MSRTLFFYIFKDLVRIFLLTSGALAGIMSFGGLLRPVTEHGLGASQAAQMLSYFMPAMTTYSLPVAALFATTVVYGRLAADNELLACGAAGISNGIFRGVAFPAFVMGLVVSIISILFLCFIVPVFTLKVERVVYSNLAQLIGNQIQRTHQIKFKNTTIFAQDAIVAPQDPQRPQEQAVKLGGVMIVSYERDTDSAEKKEDQLQIPRDFYIAKETTIYIRRSRTGEEFTIEARLEGGTMFPRTFSSGSSTSGGLAVTTYGPEVISSLIKEDTKFMDIRRLQEMQLDLRQSKRVQEQLQKIIRARQQEVFLSQVEKATRLPGGRFEFIAGQERYDLVNIRGGASNHHGKLTLGPKMRIVQKDRTGRPTLTADANEIQVTCAALPEDKLSVQFQLKDVVVEAGEEPNARLSFARTFIVDAPIPGRTVEANLFSQFGDRTALNSQEWMGLHREWMKIRNGIISEMHARASFAVSCLILVMVGCYLGMMFRSGNFLNAFALSVMPALLCIALIVSGQHTAMNIPWDMKPNFQNPLNLGIALIWSGNVAALALAITLGLRIQRQ